MDCGLTVAYIVDIQCFINKEGRDVKGELRDASCE